ncbi:uncharacterized protein G2W53_038830 [Senna tora]|uniref:Uncharacterized protein n=1 Tax=Senna tora TaxID=362788 RepID=A0A834T094_9FABA|nr:uncharacterized protein G2W53_038830 [Senna tora]
MAISSEKTRPPANRRLFPSPPIHSITLARSD